MIKYRWSIKINDNSTSFVGYIIRTIKFEVVIRGFKIFRRTKLILGCIHKILGLFIPKPFLYFLNSYSELINALLNLRKEKKKGLKTKDKEKSWKSTV